jgi:hypothetical protein
MGILGKAFTVVLLAVGLCSAFSLTRFLPSRSMTVDEVFATVPVPSDLMSEAEIDALPPVDDFDSTSIYKELIVEEHKKGDVSAVPMILLGVTDVLFLLGFFGADAVLNNDKDKSAGDVIGGLMLYFLCVPGLVVTTPIFIYATIKVACGAWHRHKRDEYYRSYDAYVRRRSRAQREQTLAQVIVVPSLDVVNGGAGVNVLVAF